MAILPDTRNKTPSSLWSESSFASVPLAVDGHVNKNEQLCSSIKSALHIRSNHSLLGFSLVEVTLALGIVCFSMLPIIGLLPIGLTSLSDSSMRTAQANIAKELGSELQLISLSEIAGMSGHTYFYDRSGAPVESYDKEAFYGATFEVCSPSVPGAQLDYTAIAKTVIVTLRYPQNIPAAAQKSVVFSLLAARQSRN